MTSKEALQQIMKIYGETNSLVGTYNLFLKIKQDLERLEVLEKEKKTREILLENKCLVECDKFFFQELLEGKRNIYYKKCIDLQQENEKLKKTIEILKGKLEVFETINSKVFNTQEYCILCNSNLTQQEYELLKEALE